MRESLLQQLIYLLEPIGLVWLGLLVLTAMLWWRRHRWFAGSTGALALFVTLIGGTSFPGWLLGTLEKPYAGVKIEALPSADAIVLLGGGAQPSRYEAGHVHLTPWGDRLVMAHWLFHLGKAPVLILGGSGLRIADVEGVESDLVRGLFEVWNVPAEAIVSLGSNGDTHDEALKVRTLASARGWKRVLLVTSANHMRRASAVFRAQGLEVIPAPCNFVTTVSTVAAHTSFSVPRYQGFFKVATWLHEEVGWCMYRHRGWISDDDIR